MTPRLPHNVYNVSPRLVLAGIVALILAPVLVMTSADPDLWGHVRFGLDMLSQHTLPSVDPYSFTQDIPWVNHEWLSELVMGVAYHSAGATGLALLKGILVAVFLAIVLSAYADAAPPVLGAVVLLLGGGTGRVISTLRPQLWTLIGVALLCRLLITTPRRWWLGALPVLFAFWVNFHGGWIVGAGLLAVWTAFQFWRPEAPRSLIAGIAVLSALGTLINPYGWRMWEFLGATVRMTRPIAEWQPLWTTPVLAWIPWTLVLAGVVLSMTSAPRPRADRIAMIAMLAYASFRVERLAPLFVVSAIVLMSPIVLMRWRAMSLAFDPISRTAARGLALAARRIGCRFRHRHRQNRHVHLDGRLVDSGQGRGARARGLQAARQDRDVLRLGRVRDLASLAVLARLDRRTSRNGLQRCRAERARRDECGHTGRHRVSPTTRSGVRLAARVEQSACASGWECTATEST